MKEYIKIPVYNIYYYMQKWASNLFLRFVVGYNRFLLDKSGVVHKRATIRGKLYLKIAEGESAANVTIGEKFFMTSGEGQNLLCPESKATIEAAPNSVITIGSGVKASSLRIRAANNITIGDNVTIGANVLIMDTDCHSLDYKIRRGG